ncbi:SubName: Full=Uncharacterized protein {ECO:0000313/EMBL:CCA72930.1} [Serendipita indica DSM 11827]|nr:SubName: Full=Uncharacterized protein {ECO:0000313/EMBL:CCA72930.1} [Serendipita indica DSM 11827]
MDTKSLPISSPSMYILPQITVQHDITVVMDDVRDGVVTSGSEDVWISCYLQGHESVHGKLRISKEPSGVSFHAMQGVEWQGSTTVSTNPSLSKKITAFDISPDGSIFATGYDDGTILVTPASATSSEPRRIAKTHLSTVLSVLFFPSSIVLLSTSSDLSAAVHDANLASSSTLSTVRSLRAHSAGVTDCAIIDRGKNVVSFGRDACARLWHVGEGREIVGRRWRAPKGSPILCGHVDADWNSVLAEGNEARTSTQVLDGEVGTSGKVAFVGLQDGTIRGYELSTGVPRFYSSGALAKERRTPIDSINYSAHHGTLVAGTRDGVVFIWNLRSLALSNETREGEDEERDVPPTVTLRRNKGGIESIVFGAVSTGSLPSILFGSADGLLCRVGFTANDEPRLLEEYVGVESGDGIRSVRVSVVEGVEMVWCASDDGNVRRY